MEVVNEALGMADCGTGRRVVVTGMGVVTPIGQTLGDFWTSVTKAKSAIAPLIGIEHEYLKVRIAAQIKDFNHVARLKHWRRDQTILHSERYSWLAAAAADEAIGQSGLQFPLKSPHRSACIVGSGIGGLITAETACRDRFVLNKRAVHPMMLPRTIASSAAAHIGIEFGIRGPTYAVCSAGASAAHAIAIGRDYIRKGLVDVAIVGGSDSMITLGSLLSCQALGLLSPEGCFPFARNRNGTVLGEGAGILVLESHAHARDRGAKILAEVRGCGITSNATDMVSPDVEAAATAMTQAVSDAGIEPDAIDYVNANGTGTIRNDLAETQALKRAFAKHAARLAISSTKSMIGHPFGSAAAIGAIACIKATETGLIPPTVGLQDPDPDCDLDYVPNETRRKDLRFTMCNAFALGGLNVALVFGPSPD